MALPNPMETSLVTEHDEAQDVETLARIAEGDRHALADLHSCYRVPLLQYLLHLTREYGLAEELLQDTLVAVWQNGHTLAGRSSVRAWLFGIARRRVYKRLRRREPALTTLMRRET